MTARAAIAALLLGSAGCLQIPDEDAPQCYTTDDCNAAQGEVCQEGVCYGDPPSGAFAVAVGAPSDRPDLVGIERPSEDLPDYGFLADLTLEAPVTLSGAIALSCAPALADCKSQPLSASIVINRPPRFAGGAGFHQVVRATPGDGGASFTLAVPRTRPIDHAYTITVVPDDEAPNATTPAPAELVPPLRVPAGATDNVALQLVLGGDDLVTLEGDLLDSDGSPLAGYRVSALGRWTDDEALTEVSSVAYTQDGHYKIVLSAGLVGTVELVAKPIAADAVAPTLTLAGLDPAVGATHDLVQPAALGVTRFAKLTIEGKSSGGEVQPIAGARVIATADLAPGAGSGSGSGSAVIAPVHAVMSVELISGDDGTVQLPLLDGPAFAAGYHLRVVPPAGSSLAVLDEDGVAPVDGTRVLKPRFALQGTVVDANGDPVRDVSVTATPSLDFTWSLDDAAQQFLAQIPAPTTVTPDSGDFVVFVDPSLGAVAGRYDLTFEPPTGSSVPGFTLTDVAVPSAATGDLTLPLGRIALPVAAALHGRVSDPGGNAVEGSELRVFRLPVAGGTDPCKLPGAPKKNCQAPAQLQAHATSDADGVVRFTLPRP